MQTSSLSGSYIRASSVTNDDLHVFFDIFRRHYDNVDFDQFRADFIEKDYVIILKDGNAGAVRGFSTIAIYDRVVQGERIKLLFSGDTVIERSHWGQQELLKTWCSIAAGIYERLDINERFYWLLMSKGYRTYLYLPFFFKEFYPRADVEWSALEKGIIDDFGMFKYPDHYDPSCGLIVFDKSPGKLKSDIANTPVAKQKNPHVSFFLKSNPRFAEGDELVCLARIQPGNMMSLAKRSFVPTEEALFV